MSAANLRVVCPKHGSQIADPSYIEHVTTSNVVAYRSNKAVQNSLDQRRKTPVICCEVEECDNVFTCIPNSRLYDIQVMLIDSESDSSEEDIPFVPVEDALIVSSPRTVIFRR